ncbi:MAG: HAMP domain-containing histidine kinase, partial [Bacteroidetes bacterium]|nr:HAMP domain-containing histidine kinase [Bacteroidota bacterium]
LFFGDFSMQEMLADENFSFFLFYEDSLMFWSDNSIVLPETVDWESKEPKLVSLPNLYGLCLSREIEHYTLSGIIPLQYRFSLENEFLSNRFLISGGRGADYQLAESDKESTTKIYDSQGQLLFALKYMGMSPLTTVFWYFAFLGYVFGLLSLLLLMMDLFDLGFRIRKSNWWFLALAADLFLFRYLLSYFSIPGLFYQSIWFDTYTNPVWLFESRGETLISLIFILFFGIAGNKHFNLFPQQLISDTSKDKQRKKDSFSALGWIIIFVSWLGLARIWSYILIHREDVLEVHKILSLNAESLIDLILMTVSLAVFGVIFFKICRENIKIYSPIRFPLVPIVTGIIFFSVSRYMGYGPGFGELAILVLLIVIAGFIIERKHNRLYNFGVVLVILLFSVFMVIFLDTTNLAKDSEIQTELMQSLSNEHDPIAEMLLERLEGEIYTDTVLLDLIRDPYIIEDAIHDYLLSNHFGPYWNRYDIKVNVCDSANILTIEPEIIETPCLEYWNGIKESEGEPLSEDSHFYYRDMLDGIVWYLGILPVYTRDSTYVYHLIISAEQVLVPESLGYPGVLIAGEDRLDIVWDRYAYAKYQDCQLISRSGEYNYSTSCVGYPSGQGQITHFELNDFDHWIYQIDEISKIVLSKPKIRILDHLMSFSYLFVGLYLIWLILSAVFYLPKRIRTRKNDLKLKIQFTLVSILLISFLLVGGGMFYFINQKYDDSNLNTISEKAQSVLIEVQHKLEFEDELNVDWQSDGYSSLQALLVKFSYVFNTDINLFHPSGEMLASSRPEVFNRNLIGNLMNPTAYYHMETLDEAKFIHRESIGDLGYWSAYIPFYNTRHELLAYLNLPYFSKQHELRKEVSTFLVAILNGYFLLIFMAVVFAVVIGNQVTRPLRLLQDKFSHMHLGGSNTQIAYEKNDEIGGLVKAYNQMVQELEVSAQKLAKSERESAWREMAKQIAHEIKNPLTPMKLSIQHLKRSWDDKVDDWDVYLERVTQTLVEQIDSLSAIANEFSQFAQMPRANRQEIDVIVKIKNSISMFKESGGGSVDLVSDIETPIMVLMDKEQLLQVLNNLLNNALQSVPARRKPEIIVRVSSDQNKAIIAVSDNGSGIPEKMREKLFQPNFTTKTSGMGLGLAISRNIIKNSDGRIWFETVTDKGSTFYIELPLV